MMSRAPESKIFYGWWIVLVTFVCCAVWSGSGSFAFSIFVRPLQAEFGWSRASIMAAFTILFTTIGLLSPFVGRVIDRYGPRGIMAMGAGITGVSFCSLSFVNTLWHYYISYFFIGFGIAAVGQVPLTAVVSNWFKVRRGMAVGIMASGIGVGGLVMAPFVGAFLMPRFGWRASYFALGLLTFGVMVPLVLLVIRARPSDMGLYPDGKKNDTPSPAGAGSLPPAQDGLTMGRALVTTALWLIAGSFMLSQFSVMGTLQTQVPHLQDAGFPIGIAASALGGIGLLSAFSKITFGWLCDRIKPKYAGAIGLTLSIVGTLILMRVRPASSTTVLWLYVFFFGFGSGHWLPVVSMLVSTTFGMASYGAIFGLVILFLNFGVSFGPLTAGFIYDSTQSYVWAFILFCALNLIALLGILCVRQPGTEKAGGQRTEDRGRRAEERGVGRGNSEFGMEISEVGKG